MQLLGEYSKNFTIDLDDLWTRMDKDGNKMLDQNECKSYLKIIKQYTDKARANNYNEKIFVKLFT